MSVKKQQSGPVGYVCSLACNSCWSSEKDFKRHTHTQSHTHNMSIKYPWFVNPVAGSDGEADDDEEKNETQDGSQEAVLRDYRYNLQVTLMASQRALKASLFFQWSSFYRWETLDRWSRSVLSSAPTRNMDPERGTTWPWWWRPVKRATSFGAHSSGKLVLSRMCACCQGVLLESQVLLAH